MKRKHLESALSSIQREFPDPNISLEQYPTSAELTASIILMAVNNDDLGPGRTALDLGCGTGMLTAGCALVECDQVIGLDCDEGAVSVAKSNIEELELEERVDFVLGKVKWSGSSPPTRRSRDRGRRGRGRGGSQRHEPRIPEPASISAMDNRDDGIQLAMKCVDTVLTNPPFGTKHNAGIDVQFLRAATRLARRAVYSFHKTSTRDYLIRKIRDEWGMEASVAAQMRFDIPNTYKFHQKNSVDIEVDLIRVLIPLVKQAEL